MMPAVCKPVVNTSLVHMNGLQRCTESFRYIILCVEHWISPDGKLRVWVKANARLTVLLAAPTFIAFPVVTVALWELEAWTNSLTTITSKLIVLPFLTLLAVASITISLKFLSVFKR